MRIDTHVHCKTWKFPQYGKKSAMQTLVEEALDADVYRVFDMPNIENPLTGRPVTRKADVEARLGFARQQGVLEYYGTYIAATPDKHQLEEAASVASDNNFVPGIKAYMGTSVGTLGIPDGAEQKAVYTTLSDCGYKGVIALHCEDDGKFDASLWDPKRPETHCMARPLGAELSSIRKQLDYAREADFEGTLFGCHVTSRKSIELFAEAVDYGIRTAVEVTPHHALLNAGDMGPMGTFGKMNPPLRPESEQKGLLECLKSETRIPMTIGTDHAHHPLFKKIRAPYMSGMGVDVYALYGKLIEELDSDAHVSYKRVEDLTLNNAVRIFGKSKCRVA